MILVVILHHLRFLWSIEDIFPLIHSREITMIDDNYDFCHTGRMMSSKVIQRCIDHGIYHHEEDMVTSGVTRRHLRETVECNCVKRDEDGSEMGPSHFGFGSEDPPLPLSLLDHMLAVFAIQGIRWILITLIFAVEKRLLYDREKLLTKTLEKYPSKNFC